jgi:hypothetical protein
MYDSGRMMNSTIPALPEYLESFQIHSDKKDRLMGENNKCEVLETY